MKGVECIKKHVTSIWTQINDLAVLDGGPWRSVVYDLGIGGGKKKLEIEKNTRACKTPFLLFWAMY